MKLMTRDDLHLKRKLFHALGVLIMFASFQILPASGCWALIGMATLFTLGIDFFRLRNPAFNQKAVQILGPIMRANEKDHFSAMAFLLVGTGLCFFLFERNVVSLCLLFLALGDPVASGFGVKFGSFKWIHNKSIQGTGAAFAVCSLAAFGFYFYNQMFADQRIFLSLISGAVGALSEAIPLGSLDDNFSQPILSGALLTGLFYLMNGL